MNDYKEYIRKNYHKGEIVDLLERKRDNFTTLRGH